jgi:hypothetical protein
MDQLAAYFDRAEAFVDLGRFHALDPVSGELVAVAPASLASVPAADRFDVDEWELQQYNTTHIPLTPDHTLACQSVVCDCISQIVSASYTVVTFRAWHASLSLSLSPSSSSSLFLFFFCFFTLLLVLSRCFSLLSPHRLLAALRPTPVASSTTAVPGTPASSGGPPAWTFPRWTLVNFLRRGALHATLWVDAIPDTPIAWCAQPQPFKTPGSRDSDDELSLQFDTLAAALARVGPGLPAWARAIIARQFAFIH